MKIELSIFSIIYYLIKNNENQGKIKNSVKINFLFLENCKFYEHKIRTQKGEREVSDS